MIDLQPPGQLSSDQAASTPDRGAYAGCLVMPVPVPGGLLAAVQAEWDSIDNGQPPEQDDLPRPWEPATCTAPALRQQLWNWLEKFVQWANDQHLWDPADLIPPCWPSHPHIVNEIAVLAEQRRRASRTTNAAALEQWQTQTLPAFLTRSRDRVRRHCTTDHQPTPAAPAHSRHQGNTEVAARRSTFEADLASMYATSSE